MKYFSLIWAGLWRKRTRTVFTMLSVVVAFLLFGLLQGFNQGFHTLESNQDLDRLYITAKSNMTDGLPIAHLNRIKSVPGVKAVSHWTYFGGFSERERSGAGIRYRRRWAVRRVQGNEGQARVSRRHAQDA
jgi:putative ABC transport system permease protein